MVNSTTIAGNGAMCANYCSGWGGGIFNAGNVTVNDSSLTGNVARGNVSLAYGGGIYNLGWMTINNSTISGNTIFGRGGGIYNRNGSVTINNTTISGNVAGYYGVGTNIYNSGAVVIQSSIVAYGVNGNCAGSVTSIGYNLSSDGTCTFNNVGDLDNTDPLLGPLQNNGGPTETMALLPGSPAIDAGNLSGCTDGQGNALKTDQRGMPRPDAGDAGRCDIGAYETQN